MFKETKSTIEVPEKKVRIYDMKVAQGIDKVMALHNPRYPTYNTIMVEAMKFGLPKILEDIEPQSMLSDQLKNESDRIISHSNRLFEKLEKHLNKILVSTVFTQEVVTCILNEIETLLAQNNIAVTEEMRLQFINTLAAPLDTQYREFLSKLGLDNG